MTKESTIYIVEDDEATRAALLELLTFDGHRIKSFGSAEEFIEEFDGTHPASLLLDQQLPGMTGIELLEKMNGDGITISSVLLTAHADTDTVVRAMQHGATNVLEKPCNIERIRSAIMHALQGSTSRFNRSSLVADARDRIGKLSAGEHEVMMLVLQGTPNKQIARMLEVSVRTVETRRTRIYRNTQVGSVAELVRLCVTAGVVDA